MKTTIVLAAAAAKFALGQVVHTPTAMAAIAKRMDGSTTLASLYMSEILARHMSGDWGNVCDEDKASNDEAIANKDEPGRVLSAYAIDPALPAEGHGDNCVWIITEWDRSVTTILLPSDY